MFLTGLILRNEFRATRCIQTRIYRGPDKSLARPGSQPNSKFYKPLKKKKKSGVCPSNQVSAAAMTSALDEKWRPSNFFFSRVGLRTYQHPGKCTVNVCEY